MNDPHFEFLATGQLAEILTPAAAFTAASSACAEAHATIYKIFLRPPRWNPLCHFYLGGEVVGNPIGLSAHALTVVKLKQSLVTQR
jgi:hypothetical protein